jgi:hypothetical protein
MGEILKKLLNDALNEGILTRRAAHIKRFPKAPYYSPSIVRVMTSQSVWHAAGMRTPTRKCRHGESIATVSLYPGFPSRRPWFDPDQVMWDCGGQSDTGERILPDYFGFFCQFSFHQNMYTHLSFEAGSEGQLWYKSDMVSMSSQPITIREYKVSCMFDPVLYLLYISDVPATLNSTMAMFADGTTVMTRGETVKTQPESYNEL